MDSFLAAYAKEVAYIAAQMQRLKHHWKDIKITDLSWDKSGPFRLTDADSQPV